MSSDTHAGNSAQSESREDRRERYRTILDAIHHNTGDPQMPLITATALWTVIRNSSLSVRESTASLKAARDNGHVIRWKNGDGKPCYALTASAYDEEIPNYDDHGFDGDDVDALESIIETEVSRSEPDQDIIGWCNTRLAEIDDDQEEENDA